MINNSTGLTTAYYMYPRSSISNYPFMLANSVGIIDAGYRGPIIAKVRYFKESNNDEFNIIQGIKLFQICAPDLSPLRVKILRNRDLIDNIHLHTARGSNGFGSTGN